MIHPYDDAGQFWLPDDPERKVGGSISYVPGERPMLRLTGSFNSMDSELKLLANWRIPHEEKIVLGSVAKGREVTLCGCRSSNEGVIDLEFGGVVTKGLEVATVFRGLHLVTEDELAFARFEVELSHLGEWADLFRIEPGMCPRVEEGVHAVGYRLPEAIDAVLGNGWLLRFGVNVRGPSRSRPQRAITVTPTAVVELRPPTRRTLQEGVDQVRIVSTFLSLAAQQPSVAGRLSVFPGGSAAERDPRMPELGATVLYQNPDAARQPKDLVPPHDFLFVLADMEVPEKHLRSWEQATAEIGSTVNLYMAELRELGIHLEPRFLRFVQALEGYHRRRFDNAAVAETEHDARLTEILAASPEKHRDWLAGKLKYSNEPCLAARIAELCRVYATVVDKIDRKRSWCERVADIRNRLSHQTTGVSEREIGEILTVTERMKLVLDLCLLSECGFGAEQIQQLVERYWRRHPPLLAVDATRLLH